jgi:SAM-dependent MidA family methyltransferase
MELALYAPGLGYYVAGAPKLGAGGDFVTAPEISPLFGRCLAAQCAQVLDRLGGGELLELGAGSGVLAAQILEELDRLGVLPERYLILEPSPDLQSRQRELLGSRVPRLATRCAWIGDLPGPGFRGVVIANEVLDAMPVHRFRVRPDGGIDELFVGERDGRFDELRGPVRSPGLAEAIAAIQRLGYARSAGYTSEVNLRLSPWLSALGERVRAGLVLLIDYGYPRGGYYQADRAMGTLVCHLRHRAHGDPYQHIGLQDITAHVDFTAVADAASAAGFRVAGFSTQAHFLIGCGIDHMIAEAASDIDLVVGAKQLLLPSAMGEQFKALALTKETEGPLLGFAIRDLRDRL